MPSNGTVTGEAPPRRVSWLGLIHRFSTGGAVMVYHGIEPKRDDFDPRTIHVSVDQFAATVRALKRISTVVPLRELIARRRSGKSTKGLSAVTFDDAYASVAHLARDVIVAEAIPVTVFVVVEAARRGEAFWWDRLDSVNAVAGVERWRSLELELGLPGIARANGRPIAQRFRPLRQWILTEHAGRWPVAYDEPLARLEHELDCTPTQRPLSFAELDTLLACPLVDVGAHSLTHPVLPLLSDDAIRHEVRTSFRELRERYPGTLPVLTPPFGLFDERTVRIGREEGLTSCLTLEPMLLDDASSCEMIPRFGLTTGHRPWKAILYALGMWRGVRLRRRPRAEHPRPQPASAS